MIWRVLLLCFLPMPALALSCIPYGIQDAYLDAVESPEAYVIVRGKLTFDTSMLPKVDWNQQDKVPPVTNISARISGVHLGSFGKRASFSKDITLSIRCFGPWCGGAHEGDVVAFLRRDDTRYVLETDPCGGFLFAAPNAEHMRSLQQCLDGKSCKSTTFPE
ncbi:MAG: hypothetical protein ABJN14_05460 [Paracoccaceae bacterium]